MSTVSVGLGAVALLTAVLGGCGGTTFDSDGLRRLAPAGNGFTASLSREYRDIALFEADRLDDRPSAARFGRKAMQAAAGQAPRPESLVDRRLTREDRDRLAAARQRLTAVLADDAAHLQPSTAARAQANFDCWVERQEDNRQADAIARCRDAFYAALTRIEAELVIPRLTSPGPSASATVGRPAEVITVALVPAPAAEPERRAYTVFFPFDSAGLTVEARQVTERIAEMTRNDDATAVVLSGHADRAGPAPHNDVLSRQRAEAVRAALLGFGLAADRIVLTAHGERQPRVQTPDGFREPRNRRVEIIVSPTPAL